MRQFKIGRYSFFSSLGFLGLCGLVFGLDPDAMAQSTLKDPTAWVLAQIDESESARRPTAQPPRHATLKSKINAWTVGLAAGRV
jgi:hypothetical protein